MSTRVSDDVTIWCQRVEQLRLQRNFSRNPSIAKSIIFNNLTGFFQNATRARVIYPYSDGKTSVNLKIGDIVDVIQWKDYLGNPEWAMVRMNNSYFFYPSRCMAPLW